MTPESELRVIRQRGASDAIYGLGVIGAWAYFIGRAPTPRLRVLGFLKGILWPAILVYELLKFFNEELTAPLPLPPASSPPVPSQLVTAPTVRPARKTARGGRPKKKAIRK